MKKSLKKTIKKMLDVFFTSTLIFVVVLGSFSYQIVFTSRQAFAEEDGGTTVLEHSGSSEEEVKEEEKTEEEKEDVKTNKETAGSEEKPEEKSDAVTESGTENTTEKNVPDATSGSTNSLETAGTTENKDLGENVLAETSQNSEEESCFCQKKDFDLNELIPDDCQKDYAQDCQCLVDYCADIVNVNNAKEVKNTTSAESITGGDSIVGGTECAVAAPEISGSEESSEPSEEEKDKTTKDESAIESGDAVAQATTVNEINTNIYTDNGQEVVKNIEGDYTEDVNLLETFDSILENSKNLYSENESAFEKVNIVNVNSASEISNTTVAIANSGNNEINGTQNDASITTGNANAVSSAVNLINTNIVGNNWLFAIVNVFGNWTGDLIVPGEGLLNTPAGKMIFEKVKNINHASSVENFVNASSNTGNNSENSTSGSAIIDSGNATASSSSANLVNTNITKNNWFFLLINNAGNWMGRVINWNSDSGEQNTVYEYDFGTLEEKNYSKEKIVDVYNENKAANVSNYVSAVSDTGNNTIEGSENASIKTGDANAIASAFNFVNTNIVGNNWLFAVVNNAGNWVGNVIFGYPDLNISLNANKNEINPGEAFHYTINYKNIGKAKCDNAEIMLSLPEYLSYVSDSEGSGEKNGGNYYWSFSGLKPGEEKSFNVFVKLDGNVPKEVATLGSVAGIRTETTEKELSNNYASETISVVFPGSVVIDDGYYYKNIPEIQVSRKDDSEVALGAISSHYIIVKNSGNRDLYNVLIKERIKDPNGNVAAEYSWSVPKLKKGQKGTIEYQIFLSAPATLGTYKHSAFAVGYDKYGFEATSKKATAKVNLVSGGIGYLPQQQGQSIPEEAIQGAESYMPTLLVPGMEKTDLGGYFKWLWLLVLVLAAYYLWKKRFLSWQKFQEFSKQMANFFGSLF